MAAKRRSGEDVREVLRAYPPGTRLLCARNGRTYQMGVRLGTSRFWMLCEPTGVKGAVEAEVVLREFTKVLPENVLAGEGTR